MRTSNFIPVDKLKISCPVCFRKQYCMVTPDLTAVICRRVESKHLPNHGYTPKPTKKAIEGVLYVLRDELSTVDSYRPPIIYTPEPEEAEPDFTQLAKESYKNTDRQTYAKAIGVSVEACDNLRIGLTKYYRKDMQSYADAWTIPLRNADQKIIGIRLEYCSDRKKWAVKGTRNGLIMTTTMKPNSDPLFSPEGGSDVLAAMSMGVKDVAGRPGNLTGLQYLIDYIKKCYRPLILIADRDEAGLTGCKFIANGVGKTCKYVKIIMPPPGYKDLRAWYNSGKASLDKLMCIVNNTEEYKIKL